MNDQRSSFTLLLIIVAVAAPRPVDAELPPAPCDSLIKLSLPQTTVDSAVIMAAGDFVAPPFGGPPREADAVEKLYGSLPAFCRVVAHARPTPDSEIRIEVWLPLESWNGEFRGTGNGGFAGAVMHLLLADGVKRGFAVAGTNTGHEASPADARWALGHPEKVVDFGWRAIHEMTTTARAVVEAFYGRPPRYSYFSGCSNGGRQALMEAQRFPGDYDGIVAGAPAAAWSRLMVKSVWNAQALNVDSASWIPPAKIQMLARAVNEACDTRDGLADGILADPRDCDFDPEMLLCEEGDEDDCLTPPQVAALEAIYRGPQGSDGTSIYPGIPPGAEGGSGGWINWITGPEPRRTGSVFSREYYRNMVFGDPDWLYRTADIDQLLEAGRGATGEELDATDPDLGSFAGRGGKLILYHGWNDPAISAHATVDYYEAVEQTVGEDETEGFVRLYMVPGVQHCGGGPGPQNVHGALDRAVERWVRTGDAPSRIETDRTADDGAGDPVPSWPLCPYPRRAVYTGGDPAEPSNFECRDEDAGSTDEDADTVHVAPPAGETETDRASILATLAQAGPGDVIQFEPGTYLVGEIIPIETAELTILGHANGTTLRGCDPGDYERMERETEAAGEDQWARMTARNTCGVFEMTGGHGTIRGLTFEYTWVGLALGAGHSDSLDFHVDRVTDGGYLVEDNVFRNSANGIRPGYLSGAPTVIRGNRFVNLAHALSGSGVEIHVLDNDISVPDPDPIVLPTGPLFAIGISGAQQSVFEGNRIEGHPVGIALFGSSHRATRHNVIRDNVIRDNIVRGVSFPLVLWGEEGVDGIVIEDNLIERNRIMNAVGVGIALNRASSNRILDNTIAGIELRDSSLAVPFDLGEGNGSAIWVSSGSNGNEITGNTFEEVASYAVVLEGNSNQVDLNITNDEVQNLGNGNQLSSSDNADENQLDKNNRPKYESKFVEARGIRLHYMDFGGEGLPIIFLQDFHDYFYEGSEWPPFYAHFTSNHRVLAPYPRGWSESDDTGWGYDVSTQSEDILRFMDALGIQRAVLAGRTGGTHEMTWIAEHHPERVAGLVYIQNLRVFSDTRDPLVRSFIEMTWTTCHMGEESVARLGPRSAWRPHFLFDESATVNIPSIRFFAPEFEQHSRTLSVLSRIEQSGSEAASRCADEATREKYDALSKDKERVAALRKALLEADPTPQANRAIERAFGDYMTTIVWNEEEEDLLKFEIPHIEKFLEKVKTVESGQNE